MATLNLSTNGPSISKSYQSIVNAPLPTGPAAQSPTYGQWAVFSVSTPLANAFQQDLAGKESVLKVQSTGEGELVDLIDELSDGRIQFAFVKVKDPNTTLPKFVLIGWCGEGVPERTKGYFTSHLASVSKTLHGYHVQVTARSDRDLTPQSIVQKVSDASGSIYSGGSTETSTTGPPPPMSSKPVFTPTQNSSGSSNSFNPLASRSRSGFVQNPNVDEDGWGADAPPVTRTQLEKVQSSYQPTKVNLQDLDSNKEQILNKASGVAPQQLDDRDVIKGGYQPVGKVDIAAIRRQAQQQDIHDRPTPVKGAYEPVGKVDIAAIRARAQPSTTESESPPIRNTREANGGLQPTTDRSAPFKSSERLTSLPKPKLASRFGPVSDSFAGTKALTPEHLGLNSKSVSAAPSPGAGRTFADQGGKTPAQVWAEKKARERGVSGASDGSPATGLGQAPTPVASQISGGNDWKSGYTGKTWTPVQTTRTGQSSSGVSEHRTGPHDDEREEIKASSTSDVGAIRDKFKDSAPIGAANVGDRGSTSSPPVLDTSNKPNAGRGIPIPGLPAQSTSVAEAEQNAQRLPSPPPQPPRSPTPPTPPAASGSPIRLAMPISRGHNDQDVENAREEQITPPPAMPTRSLAQAVPHEDDLTLESPRHDPARATGEAAASSSFGGATVESARPGLQQSGKRAVVQYDYEKAEDNELELKENEYVTDIEMVDENWWMGKNSHGETGLFPSNYVEVVEDDEHDIQKAEAEPTSAQAMAIQGASATALYDYEAAEDNELTFPEHAKITGVEFPDEDWWSGEYAGKAGLFPANYVKLDE